MVKLVTGYKDDSENVMEMNGEVAKNQDNTGKDCQSGHSKSNWCVEWWYQWVEKCPRSCGTAQTGNALGRSGMGGREL